MDMHGLIMRVSSFLFLYGGIPENTINFIRISSARQAFNGLGSRDTTSRKGLALFCVRFFQGDQLNEVKGWWRRGQEKSWYW
jgi:hypothetical protein